MADHRFAAKRASRFSTVSHRFSISPLHESVGVPTDVASGSHVDKLVRTLKCKYDMWALPIDEVMKLSGTLPDHQTLISQGKLVKVSDAESRPVLFLSHQWVAWNCPDPEFQQFHVLQEAIRNILDGMEVSLSPLVKILLAGQVDFQAFDYSDELKSMLSNCLVWFDFFCIPQPTSKFAEDCVAKTVADLNRAVESIPYYVSKCSHFLVLAPPVVHADTNKLCDTVVYKGRGWCRLEMVVWAIVGGGKVAAFVTDPQAASVSQSTADRLAVGDGEFTCCTRFADHTITDAETGQKIKIPCDKDKIGCVLVPLLESQMTVLREVGKLPEYRMMKASWKNTCRNLDVSMASKSLVVLPTTWHDFCEQYMLPDHLGMHFSNKMLNEFDCLPPLFYAVMSGNVEIVKLILESSTNPNFVVDVSIMIGGKSFKGYTALHMAAMYCHGDDENHTRILQFLVAAKADPYLKTKFMYTPMALAMYYHNDFFVDWFRDDHGRLKYNRSVDRVGNNILHTAATLANLDFIREAVDHEPNFDARNYWGAHLVHCLGFSPVDVNFRSSPLEVFKFLLDNGLVKDIDSSIEPPLTLPGFIFRFLMFVCRTKYRIRRFRGPKVLADMHPGARLFAATKSSNVLHVICSQGGSTDVLEFLLEKKADPTRKNALGQTPLELAVDLQNLRHEEILRQALQSAECDNSAAGKSTKAIPWSRKLSSLLGRSTRDKVLP